MSASRSRCRGEKYVPALLSTPLLKAQFGTCGPGFLDRAAASIGGCGNANMIEHLAKHHAGRRTQITIGLDVECFEDAAIAGQRLHVKIYTI